MSEDDKAYYKEKAKDGAVRIPKRPGGSANGGATGGGGGGAKFTSQGVSVELLKREEKQKKLDEEKMRLRVGSMIQKVPLMTGKYPNLKKSFDAFILS